MEISCSRQSHKHWTPPIFKQPLKRHGGRCKYRNTQHWGHGELGVFHFMFPWSWDLVALHRLWYLVSHTLFCKGPERDAFMRSQSVTLVDCHYNAIHRHK